MRPNPPAAGETRGARTWSVGTLTYTTGGLLLLFIWLLGGDFALAVRDRAIPPVMQVMFTKFGASDMVSGLIFASIPGALGLILTPVIAYNSDRTRSRWGRRIPFMVVPIPFIVLATMGLAYSPQLGQGLSDCLGHASPGANTSALIAMAVSWTIFEVGCIVTYAVFGAFTNDVVPQVVMGRFFGLYRAVSLLAGMAFYHGVFDLAQTHFRLIFLCVGLIYGVAFTVMCLMVKEGPPPEVIDAGGPHPGIVTAVITYFRDGFGNPYFLWFFAATIIANLSTVPFNLYSVFYSESLGMKGQAYGDCITLSYAISFLLSVPIGIAADYFHPLRLTLVLMAIYGVIMAAAGMLVHDATSFGIALVAHTVMSGTMFTAWASLPQRLLPRGRFAEISSAGGIIGSITGIFFAPAVGHFLDAMHHDYRYTFLIGAGFAFAAFAAFRVLHGRFMALGGPRNYVAPE